MPTPAPTVEERLQRLEAQVAALVKLIADLARELRKVAGKPLQE